MQAYNENSQPCQIYDNYIYLPRTKNGDSRYVPLNHTAKDMLSWLNIDYSKPDVKLYKGHSTALKSIWIKTVNKAGLTGLHFHDSRHEAISRFVRDYQMPVETLAKITGHKDLKILLNTYYNPTIDELLAYMNKP